MPPILCLELPEGNKDIVKYGIRNTPNIKKKTYRTKQHRLAIILKRSLHLPVSKAVTYIAVKPHGPCVVFKCLSEGSRPRKIGRKSCERFLTQDGVSYCLLVVAIRIFPKDI